MIIRRRHTKNFTTIGNELFDDERLSLDEMGLLGWLLRQANDWEIRRPALMRRHKIGGIKLGRDGLRRIIHNLMKTGWCHAEKTRLSNGTFHVTYEIRDEPGPELSEDEVIKALSLVSSEAVEDQSEEDETDPVPPDIPTYALPGVAAPGVAGRMWTNKSLPNTDSINTESTKASEPILSDVRAKWPASDILSPLVCEKLWASLSQADKQQAYQAIEPYIANCRAKNRKLCDLSTYLKERRFDTAKARSNGAVLMCRPGTPQAARWLEYYKATNGPAFLIHQLTHGNAITTPTEWPPALPPKQQSTGPPEPLPRSGDSPLMTEADEEELAKKCG